MDITKSFKIMAWSQMSSKFSETAHGSFRTQEAALERGKSIRGLKWYVAECIVKTRENDSKDEEIKQVSKTFNN